MATQSLGAFETHVLSTTAVRPPLRMARTSAPTGNDRIDLIGTVVTFPKNSQLYGEGDPSTYLYKIVSGFGRSCRTATDGSRQVVAFYVPGDLFGFEVGNSHTLSAEVMTNSKVRMIKRNSLMNSAAQDEDIAHHLWLYFSREIRRTQDHILQFGRPARARVASLLLEMAQRIPTADVEVLSISRQDIADYLGLRIETVSRAVSRFVKLGAITLSESRKITIRNPSVLAQLSNQQFY